MTNYKLTRQEQETVIRGDAASQEWEIVTADPRIIRRMERQGYKPDIRTNPWGYVSFTISFDRIRIARAEKRKPTGRPFQSKPLADSHVSETDPRISISEARGSMIDRDSNGKQAIQHKPHFAYSPSDSRVGSAFRTAEESRISRSMEVSERDSGSGLNWALQKMRQGSFKSPVCLKIACRRVTLCQLPLFLLYRFHWFVSH
jgi:hypothetical protein